VISYKLQGSVATYLACGGVVDSQSKKGLLLSLSVKNFKIGEYLAKLQARTWLSHALSSSFRSVLLYVCISGFIFLLFSARQLATFLLVTSRNIYRF